MASPEIGETLYLYIVVYDVSVSATLFKEDEHRKQRPILFISKSLSEVETRYTHLKHVALTLKVAVKKLPPYFQAHPIIVLTNIRMARWAVELSEFGIQNKPRLAMKGQVLADFLAEFPQ